ncbi:MAG: DUF2845 domain-containing protein [Gammaproteobacteria bacterium]|nr:DUF2845 domain-containing protein [Gammaproteobacteria bacterium]
MAMYFHRGLRASLTAAVLAVVLLATPAHAFRCGSRIVVKDMHEAEVLRACGEPTTMRHIGRTLRHIDVPIRGRHDGWTTQQFPGYGFTQEVIVTEYVYNFGPRKLMRRLIFEGGILVSIESLGYGYRE